MNGRRQFENVKPQVIGKIVGLVINTPFWIKLLIQNNLLVLTHGSYVFMTEVPSILSAGSWDIFYSSLVWLRKAIKKASASEGST